MSLGLSDQQLYRAWYYVVIGIEKVQILAARLGDNGITRLAAAAVAGLGYDLQLRAVRLLRLHLTDNLHRTIITAIIH